MRKGRSLRTQYQLIFASSIINISSFLHSLLVFFFFPSPIFNILNIKSFTLRAFLFVSLLFVLPHL